MNYYYDTNPFESWFTQSGRGRLGLPAKKKLWIYGTGLVGSLVGEWSYDDEGKILSVNYPDTDDGNGNTVTGRTVKTP